MKKKINLFLKYTLFAIIATIINLLFQYISFNIYQGYLHLYAGMFIGTLAGLIVKYILDKKYIFHHQVKDLSEDSVKFLFYSLMGIVTTAIFWLFEIGFNIFFSEESAKYIGAIIGLSIGYIIKYNLDKKFVFNE